MSQPRHPRRMPRPSQHRDAQRQTDPIIAALDGIFVIIMIVVVVGGIAAAMAGK